MVNAACQHYKKNNIFQNNKSCHQQSVVNKITWILASLTCPFVPFLFFFLDPFTSLRERKLSLLTTGKSNVSSRRVGVKWFHFKIPRVFTDGILAYSSPAFSFSFSLSLSPLSSFYVCRHIQRAIHKLKFIAFFKMNVCFCKKQLAMQVPAERNAGCSIGFECLISHWLTRRGGRTYVRTVGHKWRHNLTKIFPT